MCGNGKRRPLATDGVPKVDLLGSNIDHLNSQRQNATQGYGLHYGNSSVTLVQVVPHGVHPDMWMMVWPDSQLSDFGNLSRIEDAAEVICARGRDSTRLHWKKHPCET